MYRLDNIPVELQKKIVSFLSVKEALKLTTLSKAFFSSMNLTTIRMADPLVSAVTFHGSVHEGDTPVFCTSIPILLKNRVHSVVLKGEWRDQGWGNRKGELFVVAANPLNSFHGRAIASTEPHYAPHTGGDFTIEFPVSQHHHHCDREHGHDNDDNDNLDNDDNDDGDDGDGGGVVYSLWCKAGGGGGHSITLSHVHVHLVLHDRPGRHLASNYDAMRNQGALRNETDFHFHMLQTVVQSLLIQLEQQPRETPDMNLTDFFESAGIPVTKESLEALLELASSMLLYKQEEFANEAELKTKLIFHRPLQQQQQAQQQLHHQQQPPIQPPVQPPPAVMAAAAAAVAVPNDRPRRARREVVRRFMDYQRMRAAAAATDTLVDMDSDLERFDDFHMMDFVPMEPEGRGPGGAANVDDDYEGDDDDGDGMEFPPLGA